MIQVYSLMWILACFFAIVGFMRGWNRDVIATAGIALGMFVLFQFDFFIRGIVLRAFTQEQAFFLQMLIFLVIVYFAYQNQTFQVDQRNDDNIQSGIIGSVVGFLNGYLIGGTLWYLMDINEYPFDPYIIAPAPNSPSAGMLDAMPMVILSGGAGGSGDLIIVAVVILLLAVVVIL